MKRKKVFALQHKFPWESKWEDIATDNKSESKIFYEKLKDEPSFLAEMEYRIVRKDVIRLKNKDNQQVVSLVNVISDKEISQFISKKKK